MEWKRDCQTLSKESADLLDSGALTRLNFSVLDFSIYYSVLLKLNIALRFDVSHMKR